MRARSKRRFRPKFAARWTYDPEACRAYVAKDRSSIYGGFHLYQLKAV